jgi:flagellar hook-associated protein 3 FlgL
MYYKNLYAQNNSSLNTKLFDVNKQIASGIKIQYASDDIATFTETMRLDNEITTLGQIKKSTESGYKVSNQTDVVLNEFTDAMNRVRTLMINAANNTHSEASLDAIADELRVMEDHFKNLANTSINGQFLFSGTAVDTKPIADDGTYMGNEGSMTSFLGSNVKQEYNISGAELFLGEEVLVKREVTTNVINNNLSEKFNFSTQEDNGSLAKPITTSDTIRDLMGDTDDVSDNLQKHHFYVRGVKSNGEAFTNHFKMKDDDSIEMLLEDIGNLYGNTSRRKLVNVSLNKNGQIIVEDKIKGSSKLDFHIVAAVDYDGTGTDRASVTDIDDLDIIDPNTNKRHSFTDYRTAAEKGDVFVKEFVKSGLTPADSASKNIEGLVYDRTYFQRDGSKLSSSNPQILKEYNYSTNPATKLNKNAFATDSTKVSDVADISKGTSADFTDDTLDGTTMNLVGKDVAGTAYNATINFKDAGSTFTYNGTEYDMYNVDGSAVKANDMTYRQMMDVVNMVVTNKIPPNATGTGTADEYFKVIKDSGSVGETSLSYDGKLQFQNIGVAETKASISLYDSKSGDFSTDTDSVLSFNKNNSLTIRDPKTDFFKELDEIITAVENHKSYPDSSSGTMRNVGIENAISKLDDLQEHLSRSHSVVGAQSNALTASLERTEMLEISTMTLRSSVIDTDIAEASLKLTQLNLNYQAMLSTVGKVSKLSLVNYL